MSQIIAIVAFGALCGVVANVLTTSEQVGRRFALSALLPLLFLVAKWALQ